MQQTPRITVVTPSFNQADYLDDTIRSVLSQDYSNLEYIVMDGGSTDGSVDIIRRHSHRLTYWQSGPDGGQPAAINAGLRRATGELLTFLNSDDTLLPGALRSIAHAHRQFSSDVYYGDHFKIDHRGRRLQRVYHAPWSGWVAWRTVPYLAQPGTFFTKGLWNRVGGVDESLACCFDTDLWYRFLAAGARFRRLSRALACFRLHDTSKGLSAQWSARYRREQQELVSRYLGFTSVGSRQVARFALVATQLALGNYQRRAASAAWYRLRLLTG